MTTRTKIAIGVFATATGLLIWGLITNAQWVTVVAGVLGALVGVAP